MTHPNMFTHSFGCMVFRNVWSDLAGLNIANNDPNNGLDNDH